MATEQNKHRKATYAEMKRLLTNALGDLSILAGDAVGPSDVSWQDVAGTATVSLQCLVWQLEEARKGNCESFITFPSPSECLEDELDDEAEGK